ncbi:MAG: choice-of-anchor D domain-containing protein [Akkermansiaceae bacterium]|jgi:hypothetical protein|nr:choice-of-anchor D domain-containing protein [Akkermansiaceae bacterium]
MKTPLVLIVVCLASAATCSALTESEITPTALPGKTLTFTINPQSLAPFANTGSWTGTFGTAPGNSFAMRNQSGNTVNSDGTWSYNSSFSGMYEYTITSFLKGQPDAIMTLWISNGGGAYEIFISGAFGASQTGTFTIGGGVASGPDINVSQPAKSPLTDGKSNKAFGSVVVKKTGTAKTFTIKNTGTTPLSGIAVSAAGLHKGDFLITQPDKKSLAKDETTTFKVSFKPKAKGNRKATIRIASNDKDENPFDIPVSGLGTTK